MDSVIGNLHFALGLDYVRLKFGRTENFLGFVKNQKIWELVAWV